MQFASPRPRRRTESVVPMINVVFLLLIFFLMSSELVPPPPFDVALPQTAPGADKAGQAVLYVSAEGTLAWNDLQGDAVLGALAAGERQGPLLIRADAALDAAQLAALLSELSAVDVTDISLAVAPRAE